MPAMVEPIFLEWTIIVIYLMVAFAVNIFEQI